VKIKLPRGRVGVLIVAGTVIALANAAIIASRHLGMSSTPAAVSTTNPALSTPSQPPAHWSPTPPVPPPSTPATSTPPPSPAATSPAAGDDDGPGIGDPGADPYQAATITEGTPDPGQAALEFAVRLLNTVGQNPAQWRDSYAALATPELNGLLADTDPAAVPAGTITGPPRPSATGDALVRVELTLSDRDRHPLGDLAVLMDGATHRWLAAEVDWTARP
jgi:hypothetical protein